MLFSKPSYWRKNHFYSQNFEALPSSSQDEDSNTPTRIDLRCQHFWFKAWIFMLATVNCILLVAYITKHPSEKQCMAQTTLWSPLNEAIEYESADLVNPFAHKSIYRGPPTRELEEAWNNLWFHGSNVVRVPEEKLHELNRTAVLGNGQSLKPVNDSIGGYEAQIEVFHLLHCLNFIRQHSWRDYYDRHTDTILTPVSLPDSEVGLRMHVDHCIEALRLSIMCQSDTTPMLVMYDPDSPQRLKPDFSAHHKCRNFENLRDYMKKTQIGSQERQERSRETHMFWVNVTEWNSM